MPRLASNFSNTIPQSQDIQLGISNYHIFNWQIFCNKNEDNQRWSKSRDRPFLSSIFLLNDRSDGRYTLASTFSRCSQNPPLKRDDVSHVPIRICCGTQIRLLFTHLLYPPTYLLVHLFDSLPREPAEGKKIILERIYFLFYDFLTAILLFWTALGESKQQSDSTFLVYLASSSTQGLSVMIFSTTG